MAIVLKNKDYIWSYLGVLSSLCTYVVIAPFVLYYLNSDEYGLWGVFQSITAVTLIFDFGFSTTFARNINYCWSGAIELKKIGVSYSDKKEPNFLLMKKTMEACRYVFLVLALLSFVLLVLVGTPYIGHIAKNLNLKEVYIAWGIYLISITVHLYYGFYGAFLRGIGGIAEVNRAIVFARLVQIVLTVVLMMSGLGIIGTGVAHLSYGMTFMLLSKHYFYSFANVGQKLMNVKAKILKKDVKDIFLVVWYNAGREGLITLSNYFSSQACTIICSLFLPLSTTGIYALAVQLATANANVSSALYTANQPVLQSAYLNEDKNLTRKTMALIVVSYVLVYIFGTIVIVFCGIPILRMIKPEIELTAAIVLGVGFYQFILKFRNCYTSYFSCTNRILYVRAFIVSSILCVVLSFVFLKFIDWSIWGLVSAQLFSQIVFNAWYWPMKAHQEMKIGFYDTLVIGFAEFKNLVYKLLKIK